MREIIQRNDRDAVDRVVEELLQGNVLILPCDTIYGLVGVVEESEETLKMVKGRPETKPFLQLCTIEMVMEIAAGPLDGKLLACWPGPLTAIIADKKGGGTAVRIPQDVFLMEILAKIGKPLYSTSVNVSGEPSLTSFETIVQRFSGKVALIVQGDDYQGTIPSTLIDTRTHPYQLLRKGAMDVADLIEASVG